MQDVLDSLRRHLEHDKQRREALLAALHTELALTPDSDASKREAFEGAIQAGLQLLEASGMRLLKLNELADVKGRPASEADAT